MSWGISLLKLRLTDASERVNWFLLSQTNSHRAMAKATEFLLVLPYPRSICRLAWNHIPSHAFVCTPVMGSTKPVRWLTTKWVYPCCPNALYPPHLSVSMMVPGCTCCLISLKSVWWFRLLLVHSTRKHSPVVRHHPPRIHFPTTRRPRLYFRFPNLDSSISTICPLPPIFRTDPPSRMSSTIHWRRELYMVILETLTRRLIILIMMLK